MSTLSQAVARDVNELHVLLWEMLAAGDFEQNALFGIQRLVLRAENALDIACEAAVDAAAVDADARALDRAFALRGCE